MSVLTDIQGLAANTWYEIPNTPMSDVYFDWAPQGGADFNSVRPYIMSSWSGGAFDEVGNRLIVSGGGHGSYGGNEVYAFSFTTFTWARITEPSSYALIKASPDQPWYSDGKPGMGHCYNHQQCSSGYYYKLGCNAPYPGDVAFRDCCRLNLTTYEWSAPDYIPDSPGFPYAVTAVDRSTGHLWSTGYDPNRYWYEYDPVANTWTRRTSASIWDGSYYVKGCIDPIARKLVRTGTTVGTPSHIVYGVWDISSYDGNGYVTPIAVYTDAQGDTTLCGNAYPTLDYCDFDGFMYGWIGDSNKVYKLDLSTNTWTAITTSNSTTNTRNINGDYGRWRYIPSLNVFAVVSNTTTNVWVYRAVAGAGCGYNHTPGAVPVGPTHTYTMPQTAINACTGGELIELDPLTWTGYSNSGADFDKQCWAIITKDDLTLQSVPGAYATLCWDHGEIGHTADAVYPANDHKGIIVQRAPNLTVKRIRVTVTTPVGDYGQLGLRFDGAGGSGTGGLVMEDCYFYQCEDGVLYGAGATDLVCDVSISNTEFSNCGAPGDDQVHNIYLGHIDGMVTFQYNYSHDCRGEGYLFKCNAYNTKVLYNRFEQPTGYITACVDISWGGLAWIIGNQFFKSSAIGANQSARFIRYGEEVTDWGTRGKNIYIVNNTCVDTHDFAVQGISILVEARDYGDAGATLLLQNNILIANTVARYLNYITGGYTEAEPTLVTNYSGASDPGFINMNGQNFRLQQSAANLIDQGTDPTTGDGFSLIPVKMYVHPRSYETRTSSGDGIDIGAYEFAGEIAPPQNLRIVR